MNRPETVIETELLKSVNIQSPHALISFDDVSLFTNVPVDKAPQFIRNKLYNNVAGTVCLAGRSHRTAGSFFENHIVSGG
jgi:hypothetical protein